MGDNKLEISVHASEESKRMVKSLENKLCCEEGKMMQLEEEVVTSKLVAEEADRKYEDAARKLAVVDAELERAEERAESSESKIVELQREVKIVAINMKRLQ